MESNKWYLPDDTPMVCTYCGTELSDEVDKQREACAQCAEKHPRRLAIPTSATSSNGLPRVGYETAALIDRVATRYIQFDEPAPEERRKFTTLADLRKYFGNVSWTWPGYVPRGHVTLFAGETGVGKSYLCAGLIAAHLGLRAWPDGNTNANPGRRVILVETEEMRGPYAERLAALGVKDDTVILPGSEPTYLPSLLRDHEAINKLAKEMDASMIVIDSLSGGHAIDENSSEMRRVLQLLTQTAGLLNVPVIVAHHVRKRQTFEDDKVTLDRVRGSNAIVQFCRAVYGLWKPNQDSEAVRVECLKNSFAPKTAPFGFAIQDGGVAFGSAPEPIREMTALDVAVDFLKELLANAPMRASEVSERAKAEGITTSTLYRAKDVLKIVRQNGYWGLPYTGGEN